MKTLKIIASIAVGATAGLVAGYLTAPNSGKKTRKKIVGEIDSQFKSLEEGLNNKMSELKKDYNKQLNQVTDNGKYALNKAKEMASVN
ncbi:YtxH domain-containing protein [Fulvivirga lutimaris]|uniref:YtxH domain-containing protein n=1 Tax=Fulvivirga lutimaris TaxID=1819566 RepID=UPI0012BB5011|nr:YtxH domain-containing protein [Fulvivirga lutimaris]MTI41199.1 YtxH domain-containing protein [Fulvivirga lutimaris]